MTCVGVMGNKNQKRNQLRNCMCQARLSTQPTTKLTQRYVHNTQQHSSCSSPAHGRCSSHVAPPPSFHWAAGRGSACKNAQSIQFSADHSSSCANTCQIPWSGLFLASRFSALGTQTLIILAPQKHVPHCNLLHNHTPATNAHATQHMHLTHLMLRRGMPGALNILDSSDATFSQSCLLRQ